MGKLKRRSRRRIRILLKTSPAIIVKPVSEICSKYRFLEDDNEYRLSDVL